MPVNVVVTSVFYGSAEGRQFLTGDTFATDEDRAAELERNGLVERVKLAKTTAPEPRRTRG